MIEPDWDDKTETLDDLTSGFKIIQPRQGYRFSIDAVLLSHFPHLHNTAKVFDLGTGYGVIPLLLASRQPSLRIIGIEMQRDMVKRAQRSIRINRLEDRVAAKCLDIRLIPSALEAAQAELVTCNPPFWKQGEGQISSDPEVAMARHEIEVELIDIINAARHLLKPGGRLAMIHMSRRLAEIKAAYAASGFAISRLRMVQSFSTRQAKQLLIEGIKCNHTCQAPLEPPLIIYTGPGQYSSEVEAFYKGVGS